MREGYSINCRLDGLEIRTIEYHAGVLRLSWPDLERLMVQAGWLPPRANGESGQDHRSQIH